MTRPFTQREWFGLAAGIGAGFVPCLFFAADDKTGLLLLALLVPPVVLLISPARPLLSWQLPIVTAALTAAFMNSAADDSAGLAIADAALTWFLCSVLSWPWALMFHYRSKRCQQLGKTPGIPIAYIGMVLLIALCCGLTFFGLVAPMVWTDGPHRGWVVPFCGLLAASVGIGLCVMAERLARKLEIQRLVRGVFEVLMIPGVVFLAAFGIAGIVSVFWFKSLQPSLDATAVCIVLVGIEQLATMLWLTRLDRRERGGRVTAR